MGIVESVRGVLWARKRQPDEAAYGVGLASERFGPTSNDPLGMLRTYGEHVIPQLRES
jgi:hypothetical protein